MKLIRTLSGTDTGYTAKVYRDSEYDQFVVRLFFNDDELVDATYYADERADAIATAEIMADRSN
jgi:hypothetical protein